MADALYERKIMDMQKYIPFVERFVQKLKNCKDAKQPVYLQKMETLYDVLTNKDKKSNLEILQKCEAAILKLHSIFETKPTLQIDDNVTADQSRSNLKSPIQSHIVTPTESEQDPTPSSSHQDSGNRRTSSHHDQLSRNDEKLNQKSENLPMSQNANRPSMQNTSTYSQERLPIISRLAEVRSFIPVEILNPSNSNFVPNLPSSPDLNFSLNSPTNNMTKLTPQEIVKKNDAMAKKLNEKNLEEKQFHETQVKSEVNSNQITKENSRKIESPVMPSKDIRDALDITDKPSEKLIGCSTKKKEIQERSAKITKKFMNTVFEINNSNKRKNESKIEQVAEKTAKINNKNTRSKQIKTNSIQKVKDSIITEIVSKNPNSAPSETIEKQEKINVRDAHSNLSPLNVTRKSTFDDSQYSHVQVSSSSALIEKEKIKEADNKLESSKNENVTKEWFDGLLPNLLNSEHINKTTVLEILEKVLDEEKFQQIKTIVNDEAESKSPVRGKKGLDRPNEDIQDININESILTAKGRRMCMAVNEKQAAVTTVSETTSNTSQSVSILRKSNLACKNKSMVTEKSQAVNEIPAKRQRKTTTQAAAANIAMQRDSSSEKMIVSRETEKNGVEDMTMNGIVAPKKRTAAQIAAAQLKLLSDGNEKISVSQNRKVNVEHATVNAILAPRKRKAAQIAASQILLQSCDYNEYISVSSYNEGNCNEIFEPAKRKATQKAEDLQANQPPSKEVGQLKSLANTNISHSTRSRKVQLHENVHPEMHTPEEIKQKKITIITRNIKLKKKTNIAAIRKSTRVSNSEEKTTKNKLETIVKELSSDSLNRSSVPIKSKNNGTNNEGTFKNIHPEMHFLSNYAIRCELCTFNGKDLVNHYLDNHEKVGVVISRLPPVSQKRIVANETNTPFYYTKNRRSIYRYACPFCDVEHSFQVKEWIRHFSTHTGERTFECSECKYKYFDTSKHIKFKCPTARSIRIAPLREGGPIVAFICKLCNYIQMNRKNVVDHLITQHDCYEEPIIEASLLIPKAKNSTDLQSDEIRTKMTQPIASFNNTNKEKEYRSRSLSEVLKSDIKKRETIFKNIYPEMHWQSEYATKCVLCPFSGQHLTKHYLRDHPKIGVLISRLPPETQNHIIENEVEVAYQYVDKSLRFYRYVCPFCSIEYSYTRPTWIEHLSTHTGEYSFKCSECNAVQNSLTKMKAHTTNHGPKAYAMRLRKHNFGQGPILGFVCNLCNFIQLNRNNVVEHLISQHECSEEEIIKITLLNAETKDLKDLLKFNANRTEIGKSGSRNRQTVNEIRTRKRKAAAGKKILQSDDYREKISSNLSEKQENEIDHVLEAQAQTPSKKIDLFKFPLNTSQPSIKRNKQLFKNIHPEMHPEGKYGKECVLCPFVGNRVSNHYVLFHPDSEVLISRLPPEVHKKIVANEGNLVILPVDNSPIRYACPFCYVVYFSKRPDWILHLGTHTGEFRYKCSGCSYRQSRVHQLMKHMKQQCPNAHLIRLPKMCVEEGKISAFICNVCNYIQLNRENIVNHLITQHDIFSEERISKVILLSYETKTENSKKARNALITRKLKVRIKRINRTTIEKFTRVLKSSEKKEFEAMEKSDSVLKSKTHLMETQSRNIVPLKDQTSSGRKINLVVDGTEGILKNIHPEMHSKSEYATKCALCPFIGQNLSHHYFLSHPKIGVLISRLPPERQKLIIANKENFPFRIIVDKCNSRIYRYACPFCEVEHSYTRQDWMGHFGTHTGEYTFKCSKCNVMRINLTEMKRHLKNQCPKAHPIPIRNLDGETESIFGFICNLCNFIQLSQSNIIDHMTTLHDCSAEDVIKVRLLNLKTRKARDLRKSANLGLLDSGTQPRRDDTNKEMVVDGNPTESKSTTPRFNNSTEVTTKSKITLAEKIKLMVLSTINNRTETTIIETNDADLEGNDIFLGCENNGHNSDRIASIQNGKKVVPEISAPTDQRDIVLQTTTNETLNCKKTNSRTIYRINNLAYYKMPENVIRYHCLVESCSFAYTDISIGLEYHISCEHPTIFWDGYCHCCQKNVALDSSMTLMRELKHMQEVHINQKNLAEGELTDKDESMQGPSVERSCEALSETLPRRTLPNPILLDKGITTIAKQ